MMIFQFVTFFCEKISGHIVPADFCFLSAIYIHQFTQLKSISFTFLLHHLILKTPHHFWKEDIHNTDSC
jgi:hypothetical protein